MQIKNSLYLENIVSTACVRFQVKCFYGELYIEPGVGHNSPLTLAPVGVGVRVVWTGKGSSWSRKIPTTSY